jgi:hypothetical protein
MVEVPFDRKHLLSRFELLAIAVPFAPAVSESPGIPSTPSIWLGTAELGTELYQFRGRDTAVSY